MPKKRDRPAPIHAAPAPAPAPDDGAPPPLDGTDAPGWHALAESLGALQRCALPTDERLAELPAAQASAAIGCYAQLGGSVVRLLQQTLELHRVVSAQTEPRQQRTEEIAIHAADLIGETATLRRASEALGAPLAPLHLPLYDRLAPAQQAGSAAFHRAMASADGADGDGEEKMADASAAEGGGSGGEAKSFRDLYMEILAEGAGDELDAVRREDAGRARGGAEDSLALLIDALEVGASTFGETERRLALSSYRERAQPAAPPAVAPAPAAGMPPRAPPALKAAQGGGAKPKKAKVRQS